MILYLVRHAIAVDHGTPGVAEDERPLTAKGIEKMSEAAAGLFALGISPELILSSPLPRAKQTADILVEAFGGGVPLTLSSALAPAGNRENIYREIGSNRKLESLMLVGHQPSLGEIAGEIAWGSPEHYVELKKGGTCALDVQDLDAVPRGTLLWLLTPAILRKLSRQK
jgi:phosphohistidine phosphatase